MCFPFFFPYFSLYRFVLVLTMYVVQLAIFNNTSSWLITFIWLHSLLLITLCPKLFNKNTTISPSTFPSSSFGPFFSSCLPPPLLFLHLPPGRGGLPPRLSHIFLSLLPLPHLYLSVLLYLPFLLSLLFAFVAVFLLKQQRSKT